MPDLEDILKTEKDDYDCAYTYIGNLITNPNKYNAGFILIKNTELMNKLLNEFLNFYKYFAWLQHDQGCLFFLLQLPEYKKALKKLPLYFHSNTAVAKWDPNSDFAYHEDKSVILHLYGNHDSKEITSIFNNLKNNKWWNPYFNLILP